MQLRNWGFDEQGAKGMDGVKEWCFSLEKGKPFNNKKTCEWKPAFVWNGEKDGNALQLHIFFGSQNNYTPVI